jgi:hypothetical protein
MSSAAGAGHPHAFESTCEDHDTGHEGWAGRRNESAGSTRAVDNDDGVVLDHTVACGNPTDASACPAIGRISSPAPAGDRVRPAVTACLHGFVADFDTPDTSDTWPGASIEAPTPRPGPSQPPHHPGSGWGNRTVGDELAWALVASQLRGYPRDPLLAFRLLREAY